MGRYIEQNQSRSELQQRIAADLRAKAIANAKPEGSNDTKNASGYEYDAQYLKGTKVTTTLAPAWVIIAGASVAIFGFFVYQMSR